MTTIINATSQFSAKKLASPNPVAIARRRAYRELRKAKLHRPTCCERCYAAESYGRDGRSMLQPSFRDYDNPLDVLYLCAKCFCVKEA